MSSEKAWLNLMRLYRLTTSTHQRQQVALVEVGQTRGLLALLETAK